MKNQRNQARYLVSLILALAGLINGATLMPGPARLVSALVVGPSWSYTGNLNTARAGHTATLLQNGKVLVAGGTTTTLSTARNCTTRPHGPGASPATSTRSVLVTQQPLCSTARCWSWEGFYNNSALNSAELYDPGTGTWSYTGNLGRAGAGKATLLQDGKVLVVGGYSAELYDPNTGRWSSTANLNTTYCCGAATLLQNGKVLVVGGLSDNESNSAQLYNPATATWSVTGNLNAGRWWGQTATLLLNGKVLVTGGSSNGDDDFLDRAELYDPTTGTWSSTGYLNEERGGHTATLLPNGKVLVVGGVEYDYEALNSAELYDPVTGTWSITANPNTARAGHTATLLRNGRVVVVGGSGGDANGSLSVNTAELYDLGANVIDDAQFFVRQHYRDFLNREPDAGGLAYWTDRITECGSDLRCIHERRIGVSGAFFVEPEFQETGYFVYRLYKVSFGRQPSFALVTGLWVWTLPETRGTRILAADMVRAPNMRNAGLAPRAGP